MKTPSQYPGLNRVKKRRPDGRVDTLIYHRATGIPLPGAEGSPEFHRAWFAAEVKVGRGGGVDPFAARAPKERTIVDLIDDFLRSPEHKRNKRSTQEVREYSLGVARKYFTEHPLTIADIEVRKIAKPAFYALRDSLRDRPYYADATVGHVVRVLNCAERRGEIDVNHATRVDRLVPGGQDRSQITLQPAEEALFLAGGARVELKRALRFALLTAARAGDVAGLTWGQYDGEWIVYTPMKTDRLTRIEVHLPVRHLPPLAALLGELPRGADGDHIFLAPRGAPWTVRNLGRHWRIALAAAGVTRNIHFHDLRGTAISRLEEAGCSDSESCSISGHKFGGGGSKSRARYINRSRQLAVNAYRKLGVYLDAPDEQANVVPLRRQRA